jgi:plastocyanin
MRRTALVAALAALVLARVLAVAVPGRAAPTVPKQVAVSDFTFQPNSLVVHVGETVQWTNTTDGTRHAIRADDGSFDSNEVKPQGLDGGLSFSHVFTEPGTFTFSCSLHTPSHPDMKGTIVVEPAPPPADAAAAAKDHGHAASGAGGGGEAPVAAVGLGFVVLVAGAFFVGRRPARNAGHGRGRRTR